MLECAALKAHSRATSIKQRLRGRYRHPTLVGSIAWFRVASAVRQTAAGVWSCKPSMSWRESAGLTLSRWTYE